jgi:hypothetical protein
MKRHRDAISAQAGACNVLALCNSLLAAIREAREQGVQAESDPACRLITHQIAFLMRTGEFDSGAASYCAAMEACEAAQAQASAA